MTRPLPPELLTQLQQHEQWLTKAGRVGIHTTDERLRLHVEDADWSQLDLSGRVLSEAVLPGVNFQGTMLRNTDLYAANLASARFGQAVLDDAQLAKATCDHATFFGASLRRVRAFKASFIEADLQRVDLTGAQLGKALFVQANLEQAVLREADLTRASFRGARLVGADLTGAALYAVKLHGALGIDTVRADWLLVDDEANAHRLDGPDAHAWLLQAAK